MPLRPGTGRAPPTTRHMHLPGLPGLRQALRNLIKWVISAPQAVNSNQDQTVMSGRISAATRTPKRKVLLVDDHPMLRQGLAQMINLQEDLATCGEAGDAAEAMRCVESTKPDLAVLDISMEGKSGLELIKDFQALCPDMPILVMSMHDESLYAERALRAG